MKPPRSNVSITDQVSKKIARFVAAFAVATLPLAQQVAAEMCGGDNRSPITTLTYPRGAVGILNGCSATIIGPRKVISAAHCIGDTPPANITFFPQFGSVTPGTGPQSAIATRIVQGRDSTDSEVWGDWAIVTLDCDLTAILGQNFQKMYRVIPGSVPFSATLFGYHGDRFASRPGKETCSIHTNSNDALHHNCDVRGGASGGPLWRKSASPAQLIAVQSGHGVINSQCTGTDGNNSASGRQFSFAPDNAGGIGAAFNFDGRANVYASDKDWTLIAVRRKQDTDPNGAWTPWMVNDSAFAGGGQRLAAINLSDQRHQIWVVDSNSRLKTRWMTSVDGAWSGWSEQSTPVNVKDVTASGGWQQTTHLFILGTDDTVRVSFKTGDASSDWTAWQTLGTVSGGSAVGATFFEGVHQVFVAATSGASTSWDGGFGWVPMQPFGTSSGGFRAITAGQLQDGRVTVFAVDGSNAFSRRIRAADGSAWADWETMPQSNPVNTTGMSALATTTLLDGRQQLFGIASNGEIYTLWQTDTTTFSSRWTRFYK